MMTTTKQIKVNEEGTFLRVNADEARKVAIAVLQEQRQAEQDAHAKQEHADEKLALKLVENELPAIYDRIIIAARKGQREIKHQYQYTNVISKMYTHIHNILVKDGYYVTIAQIDSVVDVSTTTARLSVWEVTISW